LIQNLPILAESDAFPNFQTNGIGLCDSLCSQRLFDQAYLKREAIPEEP